MSYSKSSGKPFEYASKISHRHIIADKDIQQYINKCVIPFEGKDVELNPSLLHDITYPTKNRIQNIIAIGRLYYHCCKKEISIIFNLLFPIWDTANRKEVFRGFARKTIHFA